MPVGAFRSIKHFSINMRSSMLALLLSFILVTTSVTQDTLVPTASLRDGQTLTSAGDTFELGIFNVSNSLNRYLAIRFKNVPSNTVVWVANRESPLINQSGTLSVTDHGILVLLDGKNRSLWSSNSSEASTHNAVVQLLDSGNLVVKDGSNTILWQSFDYPTDILLPGMKIGSNLMTGQEWYLSSWKSTEDPAQGEFSMRIDLHGVPQLVLRRGSDIQFRAGPWNGIRFTGDSSLKRSQMFSIDFVSNEKEVYFKNKLIQNDSVLSMFQLLPSGLPQAVIWTKQKKGWEVVLMIQIDPCDYYAHCGAYAVCNPGTTPPICSCSEGFTPKSSEDSFNLNSSAGCSRMTSLVCGDGDGFFKHSDLKLPDTSSARENETISLKECETLCLMNCSCTAYASSDIRAGRGCLLWYDDLIDMRQFTEGGQDLYIRVAASELVRINGKNQSKVRKQIIIISSCIFFVAMVMLLGFILHVRRKKLKKQEMIEDMDLPLIDFNAVANATSNFSSDNKLGEGGFGPVYKGKLVEGKEIAVKRLSSTSGQGPQEFKNEVMLIAKLQHRNLVKLLGCCIQGEERMLIYEYMPNKSLDYFIFDRQRSQELDWQKRLDIILGVARGLLYLHQDSRLRIIHRDLKASNVLLDNDMNPKISDFGMARMFGGDQTEANTNRVVGTYGYMSPEYAIDGHFSMKSDVFSFGVLVLEIVSGRRNRGFCHMDHDHNLIGHAWKLWMDERPEELMDETAGDFPDVQKVLRCIHVGLLCVQERPQDRPDMSSVVVMLGSETPLPQPTQPGFFLPRKLPAARVSSSEHTSSSENKMTISLLEPR